MKNQEKKKDTAWAWGIGLFYSCFAIGMLSLVFFCTTQPVELVRKDYYKAGVNHQSRINAESRAMSLEQQPTAAKSDSGDLVIRIPNEATEGTIRLYRPSDSTKDFTVPLQANNEVAAIVPKGDLQHGRWTVDVTWRQDGHQYAVSLPYFAE